MMDNIYEWIYGVIDTKRGKKHKISNEFCISKYLRVYINIDKDSNENRIRYLLEYGKLIKDEKWNQLLL